MLVSAENLQPFGGDWPVWLYFRLCGNDFRHLGTPKHEGTPKEDRGLGLGTGRRTSDKGRAHSEEKNLNLISGALLGKMGVGSLEEAMMQVVM